jgi:hypothetical protein
MLRAKENFLRAILDTCAVGSSAQPYTLSGHGNGTVKYVAGGTEWRVVHLVSNGFNQEPLSPPLFVKSFVKPSAGTYINT